MEVQKTALYNIHKNLGAKFVPFAGYEMPIQYKDGIVKEHISTRTFAGFFDVSHMGQFFLEGDETLTEALEKIIPADLKSLKINHSKYSFLLNNEGGIIDDLIVTKTEKGFCIILNAACKENDIWMGFLLGVPQLAFGFICITIGSRTVESATVGLLMLMETLCAPIWVWLFLSEIPPISVFIGGAVIILAIILKSFDKKHSKT